MTDPEARVRPYRVPTGQRQCIELLARWPDDVFQRVAEAIKSAAEDYSRVEIVGAISKAAEVTDDDAANLLSAFLGAFAVARGRRGSVADASRAIAADPALDLSPAERSALVARYEIVTGFTSLELISRARRLYTASERYFCSASFRGAVVPLFGDDDTEVPLPEGLEDLASDRPAAAIVATDLAIYYHEDNERKAFHVTLDLRSLVALTKALSSAASEIASMSELLSEAGIQHVDTGGHH